MKEKRNREGKTKDEGEKMEKEGRKREDKGTKVRVGGCHCM